MGLHHVVIETRLSALARNYDVVLCDIWGVIHNGVSLHAEAADALTRFRKEGGSVILISNASRLGSMVSSQLAKLETPASAYDAVITSGDLTRDYIAKRPNCAVFDIGPGDARPILAGLDVRFTSLQNADLAVSSGAFDGTERKPEDLQPLLMALVAKNMVLLCANPDVLTELGGRRVQCSGALANFYAKLGGPVIYAGKPQPPIYERALALAAQLRSVSVAPERVLVIGDSLHTDIAGAATCGFASLFIWGGIHAEEVGPRPTSADFDSLFTQAGLRPTALARRLGW